MSRYWPGRACMAACGLALAVSGTPAHAQDSRFMLGGVSASSNGYYTYLGAGANLTGSLDESGVLLRGSAGYGDFTYNNVPWAPDRVRVRQLDLMPGYQFVTGNTHVSFYLGMNDINDQFNQSQQPQAGDHWGVKSQVEISTQIGKTALLGVASYSTAQQSYFVLGKVDQALSSTLSVGPQVQADGSNLYHAWRVGGHVGIKALRSTGVTLSVGYESSPNARSGVYGSLDLWTSF